MIFNDLQQLFRQSVLMILGTEFNSDNVRLTYPTSDQPGWGYGEDVIFLRLFEREDIFSKQRDSVLEYNEDSDSIIKSTARTRVWDTQIIAYGSNAHTNINAIKDGVFLFPVKQFLGTNNVFLVPDMPQCRRFPELYSGQWWDRWDLTLRWNELYVVEEDLGLIEEVPMGFYTNKK